MNENIEEEMSFREGRLRRQEREKMKGRGKGHIKLGESWRGKCKIQIREELKGYY